MTSCHALNAAMNSKGYNFADLASKIGKPEQHVADVCNGEVKPTEEEFNALANALGIQDVPHTGVHSTA